MWRGDFGFGMPVAATLDCRRLTVRTMTPPPYQPDAQISRIRFSDGASLVNRSPVADVHKDCVAEVFLEMRERGISASESFDSVPVPRAAF